MRALIRMSLAALILGLIMQTPAHAAGGFPFTLTVAPNPVPDDADASVVVTSMPGAVCTALVLYNQPHRRPINFRPITISSAGTERWIWHERTRASSGVAIASCTYHGFTETLQQTFTVLHR
jgi:hypothetical protein